MKHIQPFESFVNENKQNQIYLDESTESELMYESYVILEEGWLKQAVGYTFFLPLTLINILRQYTLKKIKIKKMLKNETDPAKKEKLKKELENISYEEAKAKEKVEDQKSKMKDQASAAKGNATPEEKARYAKEKEKMQAKLDKAKQELTKAQGELNGIV